MPFEIYLVRHGLAGQFGEYDDDSVRPLTEEGVKKTTKVAQRLRDFGIQFDRLFTSPYERAYQTAQILQSVGLGESIEPVADLKPNGDDTAILGSLTKLRREGLRVAIVGHEPNLSRLAANLIFGQSSEALTLKKAGVIGLTAPIVGDLVGQCQLFWLVPPRLLV